MFKGIIKAISPAPKITDNILNDMVYSYLNQNMVVWYNAQQSNVYIEKGYQGNAMVYAIIRKIGDKKKKPPLLIYKEKAKQLALKYKEYKYAGTPEAHAQALSIRTKALTIVDDKKNDLYKLICQPNPQQNWSEFSDACAGFYDSCGEFFIYGVGPGDDSKNYGKYTELYAMPSHLVTIVTGTTLEPIKGYKLRIGDQIREIPAKDVCHMKTWNPRWDLNGSQLRGQSPLMAGLKYLSKNETGVYAATKLLQNQGAETIVSPNHPDSKYWLNPTQVSQVEQALDSKVNGANNKGKTVVSGMPLQATQLGLSPQALQIIEGLDFDFTILCALWGIDPILFSKGIGTFSNQEIARKALVTDICLPYLDSFEQKLMNWLIPAYNEIDGTNYILDFDTTIYPELQPDLKLLKEVYGPPPISVDENRILYNFDELGGEEGKAIFIDMGKQTLTEAINPTEEEPISNDGDY
jgi:phage portal protein BeeE